MRVLFFALLLSLPLSATQLRGTLLDTNTHPLLGGKLVFQLSSTDTDGNRQDGCGPTVTPVVQGPVGVLGNSKVTVKAGLGGALIGATVGNDQIDCGAGFGVGNYYHVTAYDSYGNVSWQRDAAITGGIWNPTTATWLETPPPLTGAATSGPTSSRPTVTKVGFQYFDTTLGKPVWWNGAAWVDGTGTPL